MNAQQEAVALFRFLEGRGFKPSVRSIGRALRDQKVPFRETSLRAWLEPFIKSRDASRPQVDATGTQKTSTADAIGTQADATGTRLRARNKVSLSSKPILVDGVDLPLGLDAEPAPDPAKKAKPARIISAYAGTTLESFGDDEPLVREVLACDGFGTGTKAFAKALESLAMWRAVYGEAALRHGLRIAAGKRFGHSYVGGVAKRYDPDQEPRRFEGRLEDQPNASDLLPTLTELIQAGKAEGISDAVARASRPSWFNAQLEAGA